MKPKQTPDKQPSSPVSVEESPCQWRKGGSSEQRAKCGRVVPSLHGKAWPRDWEEVVAISPISKEDALTVEGGFVGKVKTEMV